MLNAKFLETALQHVYVSLDILEIPTSLVDPNVW